MSDEVGQPNRIDNINPSIEPELSHESSSGTAGNCMLPALLGLMQGL
jgi:hypothetical protein